MDLFKNPFHILGATPQDNRQRIVELAEERSLVLDPDVCGKARADLLHPRKRVAAEVAWLPGISPDRVNSLLQLVENSDADDLDEQSIPAVAKANLLATGLKLLEQPSAEDVIDWAMLLAWAYSDLVSETILDDLNSDRTVSNFPEITDVNLVEDEINSRKKYFKLILTEALDSLDSQELVRVVTSIIDKMTDDGNKPAPSLIDDLVEYYEVSAQEFLEREKASIESIISKLRAALKNDEPESIIQSQITQLITTVKNWDTVVQPIQVSTKSRGLDHEESLKIAGLVRNLAIDIVNDYGKLDLARRLTTMLEEVFAEVVKIADTVSEDNDALDHVESEIKRLKQHEEEWKRELAYEVDLGKITTKIFRINSEGVRWKDDWWALDTITRVRWGGTSHSVNGIPTGTTFHVGFGNAQRHASLDFRGKEKFGNIVDRLWKAVGVRMLTDHLEGLRGGKRYKFGNVIVADEGMELERSKFFASNERVYCRWDELQIWNGPGVFCIAKTNDKKVSAALSYIDTDNIHVLEAMIRAYWKHGGGRMSSLLDNN